jgi:hypothetical protein
MLGLLDTGALHLMSDLRMWMKVKGITDRRTITQTNMIVDLVEGIVEHGQDLLNDEVMLYPEKDFEMYYEVRMYT